MNERAASLNFERKLFLVPFCLGSLIAVYGLIRLGHGPFPFAATRILRIMAGITIAIVSWFLSSRRRAASLNFERKLFLVPFCAGIITALYFFSRLYHGTLSVESTIIRVSKIAVGAAIAAVSWFLSSRQRAANLRFERKPLLISFCLGGLIAFYAFLRLGHGPSPFVATRVLKIIAGTAIAAGSWFFSSRQRVENARSWLELWIDTVAAANRHLNSRLRIQKILNWLREQGTFVIRAFVPADVPLADSSLVFQNETGAPVEAPPITSRPASYKNLGRTFLLWLAFSAGLLWLGPFTNYSAPGFLDTWIYTGYFTNFHYLVNRFGLLYYPSRLPYVLFGVLMYKIFSPLAANYLINVAILSADAFALHAILSRHIGRWIAVVTTVAFTCNPYLISTLCWDYPDGPAIAFLLLGFWMLLAPPRRFEGRMAIFGAGAFWALAGYTNLIAGLIIIPGVLILFYVKRVNLREAVKQCAWLAGGVALVTVVFGSISLSVFHIFAFWMPQWNIYRYVTTTPYLNRMWSGWTSEPGWVRTSHRLATTYGLTLVGGIFLVRHFRKLRNDWFFLLTFLFLVISDVIFAFVEFGMKAFVLRVSYTSSYLLVPTFIFLGALFCALGKVGGDEGSVWFRVALGAGVAGSVLPFFGIKFLLSQLTEKGGFNWLLATYNDGIALLGWAVLIIFALVGLLAVSLFGNIRRLGIIVAAFCFAALVSVSSAMSLSYVFKNTRTEFKAAMATQDLLKAGIVNDRPLLMWYDNDERWSPLYNSIQSLYLWGYRDFTRELPTMTVEDLRWTVQPDTVVIHLTTVPAKVPKRERLFATRNIKVEDIGHWTVQRGEIKFEVYAQHVLNASELK